MSENYRVFHVLAERPVSVEIDVPGYDRRSVDVPANWLIFNAPRPLWASEVEIVVREAMTIGEFDYPERRGWSHLLWNGDFLHGRFFAAVDPANAFLINENVSLDGWVLAFHSEDELIEWTRNRYAEIGYRSGDVDEWISENPRLVAQLSIGIMNDEAEAIWRGGTRAR